MAFGNFTCRYSHNNNNIGTLFFIINPDKPEIRYIKFIFKKYILYISDTIIFVIIKGITKYARKIGLQKEEININKIIKILLSLFFEFL